ncbi:MAG: DUF4845 domain-containing protein [Gammaproteobacteria bacterium]|jgi:hypothetical protein
MGPNRQQHRLSLRTRRSQAGITAVGFVILASLFGLVGFAGLKVFPMYMTRMRIDTVLDDIERDYRDSPRAPNEIRIDLSSRFAVEGLRLPRDSVSISSSRNGYNVRIRHEDRQLFIADIYFLLMYDRQVEVPR